MRLKSKYITVKYIPATFHEVSEKAKTYPAQIRKLRAARAVLGVGKQKNAYEPTMVESVAGTIALRIRELRRYWVGCGALRTQARWTVRYERNGIAAEITVSQAARNSIGQYIRDRVRDERDARRHCRVESNTYVPCIDAYARTVGGVHVEKGFWLMAHKQAKSKAVYVAKTPKSEARHVGLELEFCSPADRPTLGVALAEAGLGAYVTLKGDGSVSADKGGTGHEICILAKETEIAAIVPRVTAVLLAHKSYVNKTCGYHVHVDMRTRMPAKAWKNLRNVQALLYKMVPVTRKNNTYCKPVRSREYDKARRSSNRYVGINHRALQSHGTLEVRLHSSTLDSSKILAWVDLLIRVVDGEVLKSAATIPALKKQVSVPASLEKYMKARIALFKTARVSGTEVDAA